MNFDLEGRKRILTAKWEVSVHEKETGNILAKQPIQIYQIENVILANPCKFDFTKKKRVHVCGIYVWCNGKKLKCLDDKEHMTIYGNVNVVWDDGVFAIPCQEENGCDSMDLSSL